jgi:hypothetical protein
MKQSPSWEANSHSASYKIPHILWNTKVRYCVHKSSPLVRVLSKMKPFHTFPPYFPKFHANIILPSTLRSSKWYALGTDHKREGSKINSVATHIIVFCIFTLKWGWHTKNYPLCIFFRKAPPPQPPQTFYVRNWFTNCSLGTTDLINIWWFIIREHDVTFVIAYMTQALTVCFLT